MAVQSICEDQICSSGWADYDPDHSVEMYREGAKKVVGVLVQPIRKKWFWEVFGVDDVTLETGIEKTVNEAKIAGEAAAKRILLSA